MAYPGFPHLERLDKQGVSSSQTQWIASNSAKMSGAAPVGRRPPNSSVVFAAVPLDRDPPQRQCGIWGSPHGQETPTNGRVVSA